MKINTSEIKWHVIFIILVLMLVYPLLFSLSTSFKTMSEAFTSSSLIPQAPTLSAYERVFTTIRFAQILSNTFIIASLVTLFKLATGVLAAYAFVFFHFKGKNVLYFLLISTIFIPFTVTMVPNYITLSDMGLVDSIYGVALPQLADATGIFLLRQYMKGIPMSLMEVAALEHASHWNRLRTIVIPIIKPAILSIGIIFLSIHGMNMYGRHYDQERGQLYAVSGTSDVCQLGRRHGCTGHHGRSHIDDAAAVRPVLCLPKVYYRHICSLWN